MLTAANATQHIVHICNTSFKREHVLFCYIFKVIMSILSTSYDIKLDTYV